MILFLLLLLEPSSILPPGGRVVPFRGITAPSAYCATAIIAWGPLFTSTTRLRRLSAANQPALWGLRDSGPYLHDGRAKTLDEAVLQRTVIGLGLIGTNAEG